MIGYDYYDDLISSVAQHCRHLNPGSSMKAGKNPAEGISCSICSYWDGGRCTKKMFDNMPAELELD